MALIKCPGCGKEISDRARKCVHCGYLMNEQLKEEKEMGSSDNEQETMDVKKTEKDCFDNGLAAYRKKLDKEYQDKLDTYKKQTDLEYQKKITDYQKELNAQLSSYKEQIEKEHSEKNRQYEKRITELDKESEANRIKYEARQKIALSDLKNQMEGQLEAEYQQKVAAMKQQMEAEYQNKISVYKQQAEAERYKERSEYEKRIKDDFNSRVGDVEKEIEKRKAELDKEYEASRVKYEARQRIILDDYKKQAAEEIEAKYNQKYEEEKNKYDKEKEELLKLVDDLTKGKEPDQSQEVNGSANKGNKKVVSILAVLCVVLLAVNIVQFAVKGTASNEVQESNEIAQSAVEADEQEADTQEPSVDVTQQEDTASSEEATTESEEEADATTPPEGSVLSYKCVTDGITDNCSFAGVYKCGADIEPGKYAFLSMINSSSYTISNDAMKEDIVEEGSASFKIIDLQEGNYIDIGLGAVLIPEQELDQENLQKYGIFTVGKDIAVGEYKIKDVSGDCKTADGETWSISSGAYEIRDDVFVAEQSGMQYLSGDQAYIGLKEGQYLILRCGAVFPA